MKPLLSICVPTFNRSDILKEFLQAMSSEEEFDEDVELVISDNCSTDDTEEVCKEYLNASNIKYFKNNKNLRDENFWIVLNEATGRYRKLQNDWAIVTNDGLKALKDTIRNNPDKNIFFTNGQIGDSRDMVFTNDINQYVEEVSTYVTSIGLFGIWEKDLTTIQEPMKYLDYMLLQVDWTYQLILSNPKCAIVNTKYYEQCSNSIKRSVKYNWFKVQVDYYYKIMKQYIGTDNNQISQSTYKRDLQRCFNHFKTEYILSKLGIVNEFDYSDSDEILNKYFAEVSDYTKIKKTFFLRRLLYPYYYLKYTDNKIKKMIKSFNK